VTSRDRTPGWVAFFISVLVCFPCACCSAFYTLYNFVAMYRPEWASQMVQVEEVYPGSYFCATSAACSGTTIVALVAGIVLLIWGLKRVRIRPA